MRTVWKFEFPFPLRDGLKLMLPAGARVLFADCPPVALGGAHPTMWVEVDPANERYEHLFIAYPTGAEIPMAMNWRASCCDREGGYVWHIYQRGGDR